MLLWFLFQISVLCTADEFYMILCFHFTFPRFVWLN